MVTDGLGGRGLVQCDFVGLVWVPKVLSGKVSCRSLSSTHILYNQPSVGGLSVHPDPARQIVNLQLDGGSINYQLPRL